MFPFRHATWQVVPDPGRSGGTGPHPDGPEPDPHPPDANFLAIQAPDPPDAHDLAARFARMLTARFAMRTPDNGGDLMRRRSRNCATEKRLARRARTQQQREQAQRMEQSIARLRHQVETLERSKALAESQQLTWHTNRSGAAVALSFDYFRIFQHGYDSTLPLTHASSASRAFLFGIAGDDLVTRDFVGVENVLRQWEKYTLYHRNFTAKIISIDHVDESNELISVCATTELRMTAVEATIEHLYPSLHAEAQRDPAVQQFVQSLLGKELVLTVDVVFHFNREGKFVAHESRANLASGLLEAIQNPIATMKLLGASLLTADGHWKIPSDGDVQDDLNELPKNML